MNKVIYPTNIFFVLLYKYNTSQRSSLESIKEAVSIAQNDNLSALSWNNFTFGSLKLPLLIWIISSLPQSPS